MGLTEKEIQFLEESNHIEDEWSDEAMEDSIDAWDFAVRHRHMITIQMIKTLHLQLMKRLNPKIAGKIRTVPVYVGTRTNYRECMKPEDIKDELNLLCNPGLYPMLSESLIKRWHIQFEKIHPFADGNGRTGRILMNLQRIKIGLPILIIYEKEKSEYYKWFRS